MAASVQNPSDLVNIVLGRIGYKLRVGSLLDGSDAASRILDIYSQTRDEFLRQGDPMFTQKTVTLTALKSAPSGGYFPPNYWNPVTNPALPYSWEYAYPDDCLKVRSLKQTPLFLFNPDPQPILFTIGSDDISGLTSELNTLAVSARGTGYVPGNILTLVGGVQVYPVVLQVASTQVVSATVGTPGTMGTPGAATVTGTTGTGTKFQASVTISGGGGISAVNSISVAGSYTTNPTNISSEPITGGGLSGATLNVVMGVDAVTIAQHGIFTTQSATFTQGMNSGSGTGVTFNTATFTDITESRRIILCNTPDAICTYTARITDLTQWDVDNIEAFIASLARRIAPVLTDMNAAKMEAQDEAVTMQIASREQG